MAFLGPSLRRKKVTDRPAVRVAAAAAISLALNAAFIALLVRAGAFAPLKLGRTEQVALQALTADQWNANRAIAGLAPPVAPRPRASAQPPPVQPPPTPEVKPPPPEEKQPKGQIVDVAPSDNSTPPKSSRFLSERDNTVEKETRSRWSGTEVFKDRAPAPVRGQKQAEQKPKDAGEGGKDREARQAKAGEGGTNGRAGKEGPARKPSPAPAPPDERLAMLQPPPSPGMLGPAPQPPAPEEKAPAPGEQGVGTPGAPGEKQEGQRKLGDPRLLPSVSSMSRITAGPSSDYIDHDIEEGDATALNTRAFRFATFFNRFKQDLSAHWIPAVQTNVMSRDPGGTTFGAQDRVTELRILLDSTGAVKDVKVVASSGLEFLDRIAVKSVRDASPYYNVPAGLLDRNGELAFDFGFVVEGNRGIPIRPHYQPGAE